MLSRTQASDYIFGSQGLMRYFQWHHSDRPATTKNNGSSVWISMNIKLCSRCHVPETHSSPHQRNSFDFRNNGRLLANCSSNICQWACRNKCDIPLRVHQEVNHQINCMLASKFDSWLWYLWAIQARLTVNIRSMLYGSHQWTIESHGYRNITNACQGTDFESI